MPAKFLGFVIRAALVFAIAVIVCRTANAAPAKTADRALEGIFRQTGVLRAEPRSRIYTNLLPDGHVFFLSRMEQCSSLETPTTVPAADREGSNRAELYGTAAGAFVELVPLLHKRGGGCALTLLNDGRVLVSGESRSDAELFNSATRRFSLPAA